MVRSQKPLGFGTTEQTADFFGLPTADVLQLTKSGRWRSWLVSGRRLFDLDEIVKQMAQEADASATASKLEAANV